MALPLLHRCQHRQCAYANKHTCSRAARAGCSDFASLAAVSSCTASKQSHVMCRSLQVRPDCSCNSTYAPQCLTAHVLTLVFFLASCSRASTRSCKVQGQLVLEGVRVYTSASRFDVRQANPSNAAAITVPCAHLAVPVRLQLRDARSVCQCCLVMQY